MSSFSESSSKASGNIWYYFIALLHCNLNGFVMTSTVPAPKLDYKTIGTSLRPSKVWVVFF